MLGGGEWSTSCPSHFSFEVEPLGPLGCVGVGLYVYLGPSREE